MNKVINITGLIVLGFFIITSIMVIFSILWEAQNESLLHNLVRISASISFSLGGIWAMILAYNETMITLKNRK
jgi:hypothetical protein